MVHPRILQKNWFHQKYLSYIRNKYIIKVVKRYKTSSTFFIRNSIFENLYAAIWQEQKIVLF